MADNLNAEFQTNFTGAAINVASGKVIYDDTTIVVGDDTYVVTGFRPKRVTWVNATDRITLEWFDGMDDGTCIKHAAAGTATLEAGNGISVDERGFRVSQNATLGAIAASKACYWDAFGS